MTERILQFNNQKTIVWVLMATMVFLSGLYIYFVQQTVFSVVERSEFEEKVTGLNSKISALEFKYITQKNNVDVELAHALGFKNVTEPTFISRKSLGTLSINSLR